MADSEHIADLLFRHLRGELTSEERTELQQWREANPANEELFYRANDKETLLKWLQQYHHDREEIWQKVVALAPELQTTPVKKVWWKYPLAAAVLFVILGSGIYWMFFRQSNAFIKNTATESKTIPDIQPGTQKAVLTLADGTQLILDSNRRTIPLQVNQTVIQSDSGLVYSQPSGNASTIAYNTVSTPRGGQYFVLLSDGTRVWLNADSRLTYPVNFPGNERRVELSGEGYFEVAKNASRPFHVKINQNAELIVLGTHFNVMAYSDEDKITTSLLEGRVKFENLILQPGQQAILEKNGKMVLNKNGEAELAIAWKNGLVQFRKASIPTILRAISRWYDVDIVYPAQLPERSFTGGIPRNLPLSDVLQVLELNNINTKLKNKTITVLP